MIKIYSMPTCPDCQAVEKAIKGNPNYQIIDIGQHVLNMKAFLKMRDNLPVFENCRRTGDVGIPCFVLEDGTVTLDPVAAGVPEYDTNGASCSLDGKGC